MDTVSSSRNFCINLKNSLIMIQADRVDGSNKFFAYMFCKE